MKSAIDIPAVFLITRGQADPANFSEQKREILSVASAAADAGVGSIQIREKRLSARLLSELTEVVVEVVRGSGTRVLVNDRADIALGAGAHGVHLPADSLPVEAVRRSFPEGFIIGVSTHTLSEVAAAAKGAADYAIFGPVFATPGKGAPAGLDELTRVCDAVDPFPVIAIGGIDETNCEAAIRAGASGIAAIRALNDRESLGAIIGRLKT